MTLRKGEWIGAGLIAALQAARIEPGELDENTAALSLARSVADANLHIAETVTGRCNLISIVLAAGLSSRFEAGPEETKLVIPLFGKPLVRHVAEAALASRARPILSSPAMPPRKSRPRSKTSTCPSSPIRTTGPASRVP